jgi:hypothetical protein
MAVMLRLIGVADEVDAELEEPGVEGEPAALIVLSADEFEQAIRLAADEPEAA